MSPAWRAQAVVKYKALDAMSAESRKAAAQAASMQIEGATLAQSSASEPACSQAMSGVLTAQTP